MEYSSKHVLKLKWNGKEYFMAAESRTGPHTIAIVLFKIYRKLIKWERLQTTSSKKNFHK